MRALGSAFPLILRVSEASVSKDEGKSYLSGMGSPDGFATGE